MKIVSDIVAEKIVKNIQSYSIFCLAKTHLMLKAITLLILRSKIDDMNES